MKEEKKGLLKFVEGNNFVMRFDTMYAFVYIGLSLFVFHIPLCSLGNAGCQRYLDRSLPGRKGSLF